MNLRGDTRLPMMYLPDVIKGTCDMLEADPDKLSIRTYNIGEFCFDIPVHPI